MSKQTVTHAHPSGSFWARNRKSGGYLLRKTVRRKGYQLIRFLLLFGLCFMIIQPLLDKLSVSFMAERDLYDSTVISIPRHLTTANYSLAASKILLNYGTTFLNTLIVSLAVSVLQIAACTLVGYGFARFEFPFKKFWFAAVIITVIMTAFSVLLVLLLSSMISRPIIRITESAKQLATGDYDVHFTGGSYREITELADTLNYAGRELSKVEHLRQEFIANVSHDLRTPLTMISGYAEVMRDLPGENTPENVQIIIDEAHRLTDLVNDLLDLSRLQSGAQTPNPEPLNLTEMIRGIMGRYAKLVLHDGYTITLEAGQDAMVMADRLRMTQVLYNLINNAINYAGEDRMVLVRQTVEYGAVKVEVIDHGEGIDAESLPYVWDRYYKVDKNHRRSAVGAGLGLSIVKGVLEAHGAEYGVASTVGRGSDFWFRLPLLEQQDALSAQSEENSFDFS